ncbi:hypothetical protein FB45DRAFT_836427 [Roridomyces roridus]|uniref:BTB domain-containing protein n=1 Tax=Roridomyces roridus TaxID=1738132 RepID=A0AAD7FH85_9AGAR|nr:hypothetical protein FB45DRAFT_836427 [Roridomyces roridus]
MDAESSPLVRSPELWFDDGTIIIQAENTLFRVYRGILAAQSPVFRDTFSIPQPDDSEQETFEGCPLLQVHDSARDFKMFLSALHDAGYFANHPVDGLDTLTRLLRIATKYDVESLRARMVSIVNTIYPSSLTEWLVRSPPTGYDELEDDDFLALKLAHEYQILPALPGIYYECCRYPTPEMFASGIESKEKEQCIAAAEQFTEEWARKIFEGVLDISDEDLCGQANECDHQRLWLVSDAGIPTFKQAFPCSSRWGDSDLCTQCKVTAQTTYDAAVKKLWDALPSLFGLPKWKVLRGAKSD